MKLFLGVDFGSTYTKLNLLDLDRIELLAQAAEKTTIETSLMNGFQNAFSKLSEIYPLSLKDIEKIRVCSSAAGGLKAAVIGLVPNLTLEAAKKAALGAGARIIKTFSYFLQEKHIRELETLPCDILIFAGGSNGGNTEILFHNAKFLAKSNVNIPILYCGNEKIQPEISQILQHKKLYFSKNIMPEVNQLSVEDCREKIRTIFFENIIQAKGLQEVVQALHPKIIPTPTAVLSCLSLLEKQAPLMLVDIGGATTDVHSLSEHLIYEKKCLLAGSLEPMKKRTVEGDLGMRYSALSVLENTTQLPNIFSQKSWESFCSLRHKNPHFLAVTSQEKREDEELAKLCLSLAVERHCGYLQEGYTVSEKILFQHGKDFRNLKYLIGTGGILIHSDNPKKILQAVLQQEHEKRILKPQNPKFLLDFHYLSSSLGLLSEEAPEIALQFVQKYFIPL